MEKYTDNKQIKRLYDKALIDCGMTKTQVAAALGVHSQQISNTLNKKNLSFDDVQRLCQAAGYALIIDIVKQD